MKSSHPSEIATAVRIPEEMFLRLTAEAEASYTQRATIIRQALAAWLDATEQRRASIRAAITTAQNTTTTAST